MRLSALAALTVVITASGSALAAPAPTDWSKLETNAAALRDKAMAGSLAYPLLSSLTTEIGPRLAGSEAEHRAAQWGVEHLKALGFENVHIESFPVPNAWSRGEERAAVVSPSPQRLLIAALGGSVATPPEGIEAEIALFHTFQDLMAAPPGSLKGKIAVVTQPMATAQDGSGYGSLGFIRRIGAVEAAKRGAVAYLMRSLATSNIRPPHTGAMSYAGLPAGVPKIPAAALAVPDAEQLHRLVALGKPVKLKLLLTPTFRDGATTDTVVGELKGREVPDETVVIGGHLDSWDLGTGAIDDGAGVAVTTAAAKLIAEMPQRPRRTIKVVMWGAEEIGLAFAAFAKAHPAEEQAKMILASECDFGAEPIYKIALPDGAVGSPFGKALARTLSPLKVVMDRAPARDGGADLEGLVGVPLAELAQDGTHYFDYHHTPDDTLDKVDPHRLDQAVATWAAFVYLAADSDADFRKPTGK